MRSNDALRTGRQPPMLVEIWSDVVCPWCYIGKRHFETALTTFDRRSDVEVVWRSFQLDPSHPRGARKPLPQHLADKYGRRSTKHAR